MFPNFKYLVETQQEILEHNIALISIFEDHLQVCHGQNFISYSRIAGNQFADWVTLNESRPLPNYSIL